MPRTRSLPTPPRRAPKASATSASTRRLRRRRLLHPGLAGLTLSLTALVGAGCDSPSAAPAPAAAPSATAATPAPDLSRLSRLEFNQLAAQEGMPLFWRADADGNQKLEPAELAVLWGPGEATHESYVAEGERFTERFLEAYERLVKLKLSGPDWGELSAAENQRRRLVMEELQQGLPTLIATDLRQGSAGERALVRHMMKAATLIERLYAKQRGTSQLAAQIPKGDTVSRALFFRNQGPWCEAPRTETNPSCSALASPAPKLSGLYPAQLQAQPNYCDTLKTHPLASQLIDPFTVVTETAGGELQATPYSDFYREDMSAISQELKAAAAAIGDEEAALKRYLLAAAASFLDNDWARADEAWADMSVENSRYYLRVGPDEVYFEPCSFKAGFHVSFARINQDSVTWQKKLTPVRTEMEQAIAQLAGPPYQARPVEFKMPDFIDIVLNAGDSRSPLGATIGQSLPNQGPVTEEGRGRTVAMTNLYTDADSQANQRAQATSLLCPSAAQGYVTDQAPLIMSTVLHEAAHNLGPAHEYRVRGKTSKEIFSGGMASTLEELKAQSAALYFTDWLAGRGLITQELAHQAHVRDLVWAFGHISRGMVEADSDKPKPYSQLAAIQLGWLLQHGAVSWEPTARAANGADTGCYSISQERFPKAAEELLKEVAGVLSRGDVARANRLKARFVDAESVKPSHEQIRERWLRAPRASFVYSIRL